MDEDRLDELLTLADQQGFKDRPLLVQLDKGQWSRLCPRDIRLAAAMVGPTETPALQTGKVVPLPEHGHGQLALARLKSDFSSQHLYNNVWNIRIKFEPMSGQPVRIGQMGPEGGVSELSLEDCQRGFKKLKSGGVIVTKWTGLVLHSARQVTVERDVSVAQLLEALKNSIQLKHQLKWEEINLRHEWMTDTSTLLRDHMHWCASEYLRISLKSDGLLMVQRAFADPHVLQDGQVQATESCDRSRFQSSGPMLWQVVEKWSSDETRNILSQYASNSVESECLSPTSRRRRVMAKIASGSAVNRSELQELGVDVHTEYTRYWTEDDLVIPEEPTPTTPHKRYFQKRHPSKLDLSGAATRLELVSPVMSPRQVESPKSPVSPVNRSRRQSFWKEQEPRVLRSTKDTRQFEFHPFDPNLILTGSRSGLISLVDADRDVALMQTRVDTSAILGLSWLRAHMNVALYGASSSGLVGIIKLGTTEIDYQPIGRFQNLSSVSINCTDDYFLVSGFSRDVSLFDLVSGRKVSEFKEIHSNFINITRFANFSPHLLATSSFDSTCKLWDLRKPATSCIASYTTPSLNVMCCFSPLDDNLLVSGLDANVVQLSVRKGLIPNINSEVLTASIPARNSSSNYRRAVYTADGSKFITSGTDENFMRVIDAGSGASQGICKFDGLLESFEEQLKVSNGYKPLKQEPAPRTDNKTSEYVQSLRGHPIFTKEVGVLLYPFDRSRSSYVCTTKIPSN
jgi:WD40 repeat protein